MTPMEMEQGKQHVVVKERMCAENSINHTWCCLVAVETEFC